MSHGFLNQHCYKVGLGLEEVLIQKTMGHFSGD
jgi:hypothetical protein